MKFLFDNWIGRHLIDLVDLNNRVWDSNICVSGYKGKQIQLFYVAFSIRPPIHNIYNQFIMESCWIPGKDSKVKFWFDNWIGRPLADLVDLEN